MPKIIWLEKIIICVLLCWEDMIVREKYEKFKTILQHKIYMVWEFAYYIYGVAGNFYPVKY